MVHDIRIAVIIQVPDGQSGLAAGHRRDDGLGPGGTGTIVQQDPEAVSRFTHEIRCAVPIEIDRVQRDQVGNSAQDNVPRSEGAVASVRDPEQLSGQGGGGCQILVAILVEIGDGKSGRARDRAFEVHGRRPLVIHDPLVP